MYYINMLYTIYMQIKINNWVLRVTNLPALVTQLLLNCLHAAHLLLTKGSFRD